MTGAGTGPRTEPAGAPGSAVPFSPVITAGSFAFSFYIFAYYSRIFDLKLYSLHLPAVSMVFGIAMSLFSGRLLTVFQNRIALYLVGFTVLMAAAVPGSVWRGGSFGLFAWRWIPAMVIFGVGASVSASLAHSRRALYAMGLATAVAAAVALAFGNMQSGRLVIPGVTFSNSNAIAITLLLGMPMVWLFGFGGRGGFVRKAASAGLLVLMMTTLLWTGSRGGIVGLAFIAGIAFLRAPARGKAAIALAAAVFFAGALMFLPGNLKARFATTLRGAAIETSEDLELSDAERGTVQSATESSTSRWNLLLDSLTATREHFFLGVGPGQFAPYMAELAKAKGTNSYWVGTHNTFTQVSSEVGAPAAILYILAIGASMRRLKRVYKRGRKISTPEGAEAAALALALYISFAAYCVSGLFNHMAYDPALPLLASMAIGITTSADIELPRLEASAAQAGPSAQGYAWQQRAGAHRGPGAAQGIRRV